MDESDWCGPLAVFVGIGAFFLGAMVRAALDAASRRLLRRSQGGRDGE